MDTKEFYGLSHDSFLFVTGFLSGAGRADLVGHFTKYTVALPSAVKKEPINENENPQENPDFTPGFKKINEEGF